jgi:lycopene cyclase domain-containing protein
MATYLIINLIFLLALGIWWVFAKPPVKLRPLIATVAILLLFTAVFDSLIVGLGIVAYDYSKTLGITIGTAPIEDFFYALLAGMFIPLVWSILGYTHEKK